MAFPRTKLVRYFDTIGSDAPSPGAYNPRALDSLSRMPSFTRTSRFGEQNQDDISTSSFHSARDHSFRVHFPKNHKDKLKHSSDGRHDMSPSSRSSPDTGGFLRSKNQLRCINGVIVQPPVQVNFHKGSPANVSSAEGVRRNSTVDASSITDDLEVKETCDDHTQTDHETLEVRTQKKVALEQVKFFADLDLVVKEAVMDVNYCVATKAYRISSSIESFTTRLSAVRVKLESVRSNVNAALFSQQMMMGDLVEAAGELMNAKAAQVSRKLGSMDSSLDGVKEELQRFKEVYVGSEAKDRLLLQKKIKMRRDLTDLIRKSKELTAEQEKRQAEERAAMDAKKGALAVFQKMRDEAKIIAEENKRLESEKAVEVEKAAKVKAKLLDAVNEKEKLRARLEPYSARLLELSQEKPSAASDFARQELLQIGQKYAETVGHKNSRQNLQQAQRYVCGNAELKEANLSLSLEINAMKRDLQETAGT